MSHKATTWLADLPADSLGPSEFRVLFHLCDCHNPASGCFPTQAYLLEHTGVSNGTLNNALNALEASGLITRLRERDPHSKRQKPTRYILGFEVKPPQEPTPENGDGNPPETGPSRLHPVGDGAVSSLGADPSPKNRQSRLQPTGEEPVKEPVNNPGARDAAAFWAETITAGRYVPPSAVGAEVAHQILKRGLLDEGALRAAGIRL